MDGLTTVVSVAGGGTSGYNNKIIMCYTRSHHLTNSEGERDNNFFTCVSFNSLR